ncbi:MAG: hypothetical protein FJZ89_10430 [Chloroflexi bacterium]|nr:hypothetical protein [Chloroflexota bacterium]
MTETGLALTQQLAFVVTQRHQDEATVLGQAVQEGIQVLYREALIESYLLGQVPRQVVLKELGPAQLEEIDYQRDALQRDVAWGLKNA